MQEQQYSEGYLISKEVLAGGYLKLTPDEIKHALQHGAKADATNEDGETPAMRAKTVEQLRALKEYGGADFSRCDCKKQTVLHHMNTPKTIGFVLEQPGVNPLAVDRWGKTKIEWIYLTLEQPGISEVCKKAIQLNLDAYLQHSKGMVRS